MDAFIQNTRRASVKKPQNRNISTINPFISQSILPGTTVYTEEWCAYNQLPIIGQVHKEIMIQVVYAKLGSAYTRLGLALGRP